MNRGMVEALGSQPRPGRRIGVLAGDRWAREYPEEAAVEEKIAHERLLKAIRAARAGQPVDPADYWASTFTTRQNLNRNDLFQRRQDAEFHGEEFDWDLEEWLNRLNS